MPVTEGLSVTAAARRSQILEAAIEVIGRLGYAQASFARIAEHAFAQVPASVDPIYADPDFAVDFFAICGSAMQELVEDPGYAALLGAFGPALLDLTGSRPTARQTELGEAKTIRHPRELRAIPNNAILQQLGWCANTLQGLGAAALRYPEPFAELRRTSARFGRAIDLAAHGLLHSDLDVLRATGDAFPRLKDPVEKVMRPRAAEA